MTTLFDQIQSDTKDAMRARDTESTTALRMLTSSLKNREIEIRRPLTDDDIVGILTTEAKKRREAAQAYRTGDRTELAEKEERELAIIQKYLPAQLTDDEAAQIVAETIAEVGAESKKDMARVMGAVMPKLKGVYDGSKVKDLVMQKLS